MSQPSPDNRVHEPFWLLFTTVVVVIALSLVKTEFSVNDYKTKPVSIISELKEDASSMEVPIKPVLNNQRKEARNLFFEGQREKSQISEFSKSAVTQYSSDSLGGLVHFMLSLEQLKQKKRSKVRIAYFGDSMIEGDLITQDLRKMLQDSFGGYGVGFMPVTSIVAGFRISIAHSFSKNWTTYDIGRSKEHPAGLCGFTFIPTVTGAEIDTTNPDAGGTSWVKYTASKSPRLDNFYNVRMFYGSSDGDQVATINGKHYPLDGQKKVNQLTINNGSPIKSVSAAYSSSAAMDVYGFSMDSDTGIFVDNFSLRGNSGLPLASIPSSILSGMNEYLGYDLVILQYGMNVAGPNAKKFGWYEQGMQKVVENFQRSFPGASILIIGAGDKGYKKNGVWTTDPAIPYLVESQRMLAQNTGAAFWSLYDAMGGFESMATKWANGDTLYANKDYTHFNFRGARKVGQMLFYELMHEYKLYQASAKN
jgi:hypothetical protein